MTGNERGGTSLEVGKPEDALAGVRVIELAEWVFIPSAAALLADWGADVIKVEHPERGDGFRGLTTNGTIPPKPTGNPAVHFVNRNKRSIGLDVQNPEGMALLFKLLEDADVLMTSFLPRALTKLGLTPDALRARFPRLIFVRGHGQGARGPARDIGSFDVNAFWARSGLAETITTADAPRIVLGRGAVGDLTASAQVAFGVTAALLRQARTGEGSVVDVSLMAVGMYVNGLDAMTALQEGQIRAMGSGPPLVSAYRTSDDRWVTIALLSPDAHWATFCEAIGRLDLTKDDRFVGAAAQAVNGDALRAELARTFAAEPFAHWRAALADLPFPWAPALTAMEAADDEQAVANDYVTNVETSDGESLRFLTGALQLDEHPPTIRRAPLHGEHTDEILLELGFDWDAIIELKIANAVL